MGDGSGADKRDSCCHQPSRLPGQGSIRTKLVLEPAVVLAEGRLATLKKITSMLDGACTLVAATEGRNTVLKAKIVGSGCISRQYPSLHGMRLRPTCFVS